MTERTTLIGERVTATTPDGEQRLTGVLLPPAGDGPPRLHTDDDQVVDVGDPWRMALLDRYPKGSRKLRHCSDGRPIYRYDDLPARQLATATMLKRARRRPAEGQQPIATYLVTGTSDYVPLYAMADAAELPPLPGKRQAAWEAARTCARCGMKRTLPSDGPFPAGVDGRRYCGDCQEPAAAEAWRARRVAGRIQAAEWAKGVLADAHADPEKVVLLHVSYQSMAYQTVMAETWNRQLLLDVRVRTDARYVDYQDPADVVDRVRALQGRRLVGWRHEQNHIKSLLRLLEAAGGGDISLTLTDEAGPHWDEWCAERPETMHPGRSYRTHDVDYLQVQQPPGWNRSQLLGHIRHTVHEMTTRWCYWWRTTCQEPGCGRDYWHGTSKAANRWSNHHHAETGHVIRHTTEPGMEA